METITHIHKLMKNITTFIRMYVLELFCLYAYRAYPGSEFVVTNTLAKRKKLEPNESIFSQGFSQKEVYIKMFVFNSFPASGDFCCLLIIFVNSLNTDQARQNVPSRLYF